MSKFFIPKENIKEDTITITGGDVAHISRVLRMGREICLPCATEKAWTMKRK